MDVEIFNAKVSSLLKDFEVNVGRWIKVDLIKWLRTFLACLQESDGQLKLSRTNLISVSTKMSQSLNPSLPSGSHQDALLIYFYLFIDFPVELAHWLISGLAGFFQYFSKQSERQLIELVEGHLVHKAVADPQLFQALVRILLSCQEPFQMKAVRPILNRAADEHPEDFSLCVWSSISASNKFRTSALQFMLKKDILSEHFEMAQKALIDCIRTGSQLTQRLALEIVQNQVEFIESSPALRVECLCLLPDQNGLARRVHEWIFEVNEIDQAFYSKLMASFETILRESPQEGIEVFFELLKESDLASFIFESYGTTLIRILPTLGEAMPKYIEKFVTTFGSQFYQGLGIVLESGCEIEELLDLTWHTILIMNLGALCDLFKTILTVYLKVPTCSWLGQIAKHILSLQPTLVVEDIQPLVQLLAILDDPGSRMGVCELISMLRARGVACHTLVKSDLESLQGQPEFEEKLKEALVLQPESITIDILENTLVEGAPAKDVLEIFQLAGVYTPELLKRICCNITEGDLPTIFFRLDAIAKVGNFYLGAHCLRTAITLGTNVNSPYIKHKALSWLHKHKNLFGKFINAYFEILWSAASSPEQHLNLLTDLKNLVFLYWKTLKTMGFPNISIELAAMVESLELDTFLDLVALAFVFLPRFQSAALKCYQYTLEVLPYLSPNVKVVAIRTSMLALRRNCSPEEEETIAKILEQSFSGLDEKRSVAACQFVCSYITLKEDTIFRHLTSGSSLWIPVLQSILPVFLRCVHIEAFKDYFQTLFLLLVKHVRFSKTIESYQTLLDVLQIILLSTDSRFEDLKLFGMVQGSRPSDSFNSFQLQPVFQKFCEFVDNTNLVDFLELLVRSGILRWAEDTHTSKPFYLGMCAATRAQAKDLILASSSIFARRKANLPNVFILFLLDSVIDGAPHQWSDLHWERLVAILESLYSLEAAEVSILSLDLLAKCPRPPQSSKENVKELVEKIFKCVSNVAFRSDTPSALRRLSMQVLVKASKTAFHWYTTTASKISNTVLNHSVKALHSKPTELLMDVIVSYLCEFPGVKNISEFCEEVCRRTFLETLKRVPKTYFGWNCIVKMLPTDLLLKKLTATFEISFFMNKSQAKEKRKYAGLISSFILLSDIKGRFDGLYQDLLQLLLILLTADFPVFSLTFRVSLCKLSVDLEARLWNSVWPLIPLLVEKCIKKSLSLDCITPVFDCFRSLLSIGYRPFLNSFTKTPFFHRPLKDLPASSNHFHPFFLKELSSFMKLLDTPKTHCISQEVSEEHLHQELLKLIGVTTQLNLRT